jgi:hypothetical protein
MTLAAVQRPLFLGLAGVGLADVERLFGARLAQHHRVDDLQVRRVGGQRQVDGVAVELAVRRGAHVIFDVARTLDVRRHGRAALELVEDGAVGLAHDGRQGVQAAAVGHAETISSTPRAPPRLIICSSAGTMASPPSRPNRLVPGKRLCRKRSKPSASISLFRMASLPSLVKAFCSNLSGAFEALLQPGLLLRLGDVHELDADGPQ